MNLKEGRERPPIFLAPSARALGTGRLGTALTRVEAAHWRAETMAAGPERPRQHSLLKRTRNDGRKWQEEWQRKHGKRTRRGRTKEAAPGGRRRGQALRPRERQKPAQIKKRRRKNRTAKTAADQTSEKPGADLLENAAEVVVSTQCEELARGLMKAAKEGNASCAKMLVELTEKVRIQKGANAKKGRSAANLLASEAEWTGVEEAGSQAGSSANEAMTQ